MTASVRRSGLRRLAAGFTALGLAAAWAAPGAAEEGPALPPAFDSGSLVADALATVDAVIAEAGVTARVLPAEVAEEPAPPEPAPVEAAPPPSSEPEPAPAAAPSAVAAVPTTPATEPTAPVVESLAPAAGASAEQQRPANVNVTVRIGSPGDNGAVTQVNGATAAAPAPAPTPPESRYQPSQPQYQAPAAQAAAAAAPATSSAPASPAAAAAEAPVRWDWTWTLGCGEAGDAIAPLPVATGLQNWNWNWSYADCDEDENSDGISPGGYQAGATQYHPVNINVSIRIGSAGSDGAVTQTNVAIASIASITSMVASLARLPELGPAETGPGPPAEGGPAAAGGGTPTPDEAAPPEETAPPTPDEAGAELPAPAPTSPVPVVVATPAVASGAQPTVNGDTAQRSASRVRAGSPLPLWGGLVPQTGSESGDIGDITAPVALSATATPSVTEASSSGRAAATRPAEVEPLLQRAEPRGSQNARTLGLASAGIASPGASDRKPALVALLALFSIFLLDVARRVASGWAAAAAESGRRPERPG